MPERRLVERRQKVEPHESERQQAFDARPKTIDGMLRAMGWTIYEMCAVYLSMFFIGSLIRYRPDILEELLGTSAAWLLESLVNAAPLLFLRTITCVILNRMILFNR